MKVKIGDTVYDSSETPIMIVLSDGEKEQIKNMHPKATKYAIFPDNIMTREEMKEWMKYE